MQRIFNILRRLWLEKPRAARRTIARRTRLELESLEERCLLSANLPYLDIGTPHLTDIWVDPMHGNDANTGASRTEAVRTLSQAWNMIPSGSPLTTTGYRIQLEAGDYAEADLPSSGWMEQKFGTAENPIVIQAADGSRSARLHGYLDFADVHFVYLIGLDFVTDPGYGGGGNVVHFAASDHVLIRDCRLNGFDGFVRQTQETLKVNQAQYFYVEDSDISGSFWFALDYVGVQHGHILNNRIHDSGDDGLVLKGGTASILVEGNEVYDTGVIGITAGQGTGFEFMVSPWLHYEAYDLKIVNNVIHDTQNSGLAVRGGYNILMANNTLYRVALGDNGPALVLFSPGGRSCDGDQAACQARLALGGWGPTTAGDGGEWIPNRNVYLYNNIIYNPSSVSTRDSHFTIFGPMTPPPNINVPGPILSDENLQIRGNVIWNGAADLPLGVDDPTWGGQVLIPSYSETQIRADNAINRFEPQLVDPAHGAFQPAAGSNIFGALTFAIPAFPGGDAPLRPLVPAGDLNNVVVIDRDGRMRPASSPPGAYLGSIPMEIPAPLIPLPGIIPEPVKSTPPPGDNSTGAATPPAPVGEEVPPTGDAGTDRPPPPVDEEVPPTDVPDDETDSSPIDEELPPADDAGAGTDCPLVDEELPLADDDDAGSEFSPIDQDEELPASYCPDDETSSPGIEEELPVANPGADTEILPIDEELPAYYFPVDATSSPSIEEELPVADESSGTCDADETYAYEEILADEVSRCLVEYPDGALAFCHLYSGECESHEGFFDFEFQHVLDDEAFIFWSCWSSRSL